MEKKLSEFNASLPGPDLVMDAGEISCFSEAAKIVMAGDNSFSKPPVGVYTLISNKLLKWPSDKTFPGSLSHTSCPICPCLECIPLVAY